MFHLYLPLYPACSKHTRGMNNSIFLNLTVSKLLDVKGQTVRLGQAGPGRSRWQLCCSTFFVKAHSVDRVPKWKLLISTEHSEIADDWGRRHIWQSAPLSPPDVDCVNLCTTGLCVSESFVFLRRILFLWDLFNFEKKIHNLLARFARSWAAKYQC